MSVADYIQRMQSSLILLTGPSIDGLDFDDDRLSHLLKHLSQEAICEQIERDLNRNCVEVYELEREVVRCDTTTVSGHPAVKDDGVMQFGHSKGDPALPQCKLVTAALDIGGSGMPLVTEVLSGETADDGLYVQMVARVTETFQKTGLLFVGDCKMSARENRQSIATHAQFYLCPLPLTGETAKLMPEWIDVGIEKDRANALILIDRATDQGQTVRMAQGYEFERTLIPATVSDAAVVERVLIVNSPAHAQCQIRPLENHLQAVQTALEALTPSRGRGKRQIHQESTLQEAISGIEQHYHVKGLLEVTYERECRTETRAVGRGRGAAHREQRVIEHIRYQVISVVRNEPAIMAAQARLGWKAYVTNAPQTYLSLEKAVSCYRDQYRVENIYKRIKSHLHIEPLFVQQDDQIKGLTFLLTLGVRVLTLLEFVVRRHLQTTQTKLPGLFPGNRKKATDQPTAERILKAFSGLTITTIKDRSGRVLFRGLQTLSSLQNTLLQLLGFEELHAKLHNLQ